MIRFVKNILDVKNVLGMSREVPPIPDPQRNPEELFMHSNDGDFGYTPYFTGTVNIFNGKMNIIRGESLSGIEVVTNTGNNVVQSWIIGDTYRLVLPNNAPIAILSPNNKLKQIDITTTYLHILDLRNADQIEEITNGNPYNEISTLYAIANNTTQRDICIHLINNSIYTTYAILWIKRTQPYASDVIAVARTKGWSINYL